MDQARYRQCELRRADRYQIAWIPEEVAKVKAIVTIEGEVPNPWTVVKVYAFVRVGPPLASNVFDSIK
jgi:hypothetical protein